MKISSKPFFATAVFASATGVFSPCVYADSDVSVDVSLTPWMASWEQKSTAANRFGSNAINVNYKIEDSIAYDLALDVRVGGFLVSLKNIQQSESVSNHDNKVSYTQIGLMAADAVAGVDIDFQHTKGSFSGFIDGSLNGNTSTGTFESDLTMQDLSVLFYKGFGVGVRRVDYELPQDLYLINTTNPNNALLALFEEITYSGTFFQLVAMSENLIKDDKSLDSGLTYLARYGVGTLTPEGKFLNDTNTTLRNANAIGANESIMNEGDSTFFELDLGYFQRFSVSGADIKGAVGYRVTQWDAEFGSDASTYQLVTDFETSFSGPYVTIAGEF